MRKAIITGGTGFIGSWLAQELLENGYEVTLIVRTKSRLIPQLINHSNCIIIEKSILELTKQDFDEKSGYDVFYHLAWAGVSPEYKNDVRLQLDNIEIAIRALEISKDINCRLFVASGTVAEYVFCTDIMDVNAKQTPNDMYGSAKVSAHYFLEVRARQLEQHFIWMVIPSTFGERRNDNNIITYTIRTLLKGEKPRYGNLEQLWDFLYVKEVVRAIRYIGEKGIPEKVYGIGSGNHMPLKDYIMMVRDMIDPKLELGIGELPVMSKQTFSSCVNIEDLTRDTGFVPEISFEEGIMRTIDYHRGINGKGKL